MAEGERGLSLISVALRNLESALALARNIFPDAEDYESIEREFRRIIETQERSFDREVDENRTAFYLAMLGTVPVGLTGHYHYFRHPQEAWLSWFGIETRFRGQGLGKALLRRTLDDLRADGFLTLRLWTTLEDRDALANAMYAAMGFDRDIFSSDFPDYLVYSKALTDEPLVPWIHLADKPSRPAGAPTRKAH